MEPSSTRISEPAGIPPRRMSASSRVVFAVTSTPALRSSFAAFCEVAVPNTRRWPSCPAHACAAAARTRVLPVPAGPDDHLSDTTGGEHVIDGGGLVQPQPAPRHALACILRAFP